MICIKCQREAPDGNFCNLCGSRQTAPKRNPKRRGNGQGSVYQLPNKKYIAVKSLGYYLDETGQPHRRTVSRCFEKKKDAVNALPLLGLEINPAGKAAQKAKTTFHELYLLWLPTHQASRETLNCYKAAIKYFSPLYHTKIADVDIDDLQECIDECPRGKSTRRNMRTAIGLMYKYGIPRGYLPEKLNLAEYLSVKGSDGVGGTGLPDSYLEAVRMAAQGSVAASYALCQCYLGFRPTELLELNIEDYNSIEHLFIGGAKTDAGKDRIVTVSPKIQSIVDQLTVGKSSGPVFCAPDGSRLSIRQYRAMFYGLLDDLGLENPIYTINGQQKHTYTPHSCRHTFATLMKRVEGNTKDKLELIGHTSEEMLHYYEDVSISDLRKITDAL